MPVIYNKMMDLLTSIKAEADLDNTGALAAVAAKLDLYVNGGKQPGFNFLKAIRLLDANQFHLLPSTFNFIKSSLPMLSDMRTEWHIYTTVVHELPAGKEVQAKSFWQSLSTRIPRLSKLAQALCRVPYSLADVEQSFSKYKQILSPQHTRLSQESFCYLNALYFNC